MTKVSFFCDPSQNFSPNGFPPKNRPLIGRPDRLANQSPVFFGGKPLESLSQLWSQKKLTLDSTSYHKMTSHTGGAICISCIDNQKILVYWDLDLYLGSKGSQTPLCLFTCMHIAIITISWTMLWYFTYLGTYIYIYSRNNSNYSLY